MHSPVKLTISPAVAQYVKAGISSELKLQGIATVSSLQHNDQVMLLFCLANDSDDTVKEMARKEFVKLPDAVLSHYLASDNPHPLVRNLILRVHASSTSSAKSIDNSEPHTKPLTSEVEELEKPDISLQPASPHFNNEDITDEEDMSDEHCLIQKDEEGEVNEEGEEFLSKYRLAQIMGIAEKIKMALTGDKEWRSLLIKDANKLVSGSVVKNPRITDGEILTILKVGVQNDEIVRIICANKEWTKNYKIRKALVDCPKTPLPNSLRFLASLDIKDIAHYAKSKNISSVLSTQAKRMLLAKKR